MFVNSEDQDALYVFLSHLVPIMQFSKKAISGIKHTTYEIFQHHILEHKKGK